MLVATSNPGKLLRLAAARAERGTYTSDVRDAQTVALWGTIKWEAVTPAGSRLEISTRSGNTSTPDETWSDWSATYTDREGSPITSPRARYLQWRATLTAGKGEAPLLTSVTARVSAAKLAAARHLDHRASRRHGVPAPLPSRSRDRRLRGRPAVTGG